MNAYNELAKFYDKLMYDFDHKKIIEFYDRTFSVAEKNIFEICCGTGSATCFLLEKGAKVVSTDLSQEMLETARQKIKSKNVTFVRADINKIQISQNKFDCVISVCDGFNYLKPKNVPEVFKTISLGLKPGGVFAFDISSEYKLKNILGNNVFYEDRDDYTYFMRSRTDKKTTYVEFETTIFEKSTAKTDNAELFYKRYDDKNRQYIYNTEVMIQSLKLAGFDIVKVIDADSLTKINNTSQRIIFVASKHAVHS